MKDKRKILADNPGISVQTTAKYSKEQSDRNSHKFIWAYEISITNQSEQIVQLLTRCWRFTDMSGRVEEIRGVGVIGLQPIIKPGKSFDYTSYCQLMTPQGTMEGFYDMQTLDEVLFEVEIPKLFLLAPTDVVDPYRSKLH